MLAEVESGVERGVRARGEVGRWRLQRVAAAAREKLASAPELHPLQQAVVDEQALQCGYCYNSQIIKGAELLSKNPQPTVEQIRTAMNGHLCRCGTYPRMIKAIQRASRAIAGGGR